MEFNGLLTATVFLPLAGAIVIAALLRGSGKVRVFATLVLLADLVLSGLVLSLYDRGGAERFQMIDRFNWFGEDSIFGDASFTASYHLAVDGLSAPLVLLTGLLGLAAVLASDWCQETCVFLAPIRKPERRRPFGTGLVRHCPRGLFSPFFTFFRATSFRPLRLSLVPTICPWIPKDENFFNLYTALYCISYET